MKTTAKQILGIAGMCILFFVAGMFVGCTQQIKHEHYWFISTAATASVENVDARIEMRENKVTNSAMIIISREAKTNTAIIYMDEGGKKHYYETIPTNVQANIDTAKKRLEGMNLPANPILPGGD